MTEKYLENDQIVDLIRHRELIFKQARKSYEKYGIDLLANDTLSALSIWEIVSQYDNNYNTNFHRNGEDAKSGEIIIEQKCASKTICQRNGQVSLVGWQFHAQGGLEYPRYILAVRRKDNLKIVRIWDIQSQESINLVANYLLIEKQKWIDKGKPNHDAIVLPEKLLLELPNVKTKIIRQCTVNII